MGAALPLNLIARDATGQRKFSVRNLPFDTTVHELIHKLVPTMGLPTQDATGTPQSFHAFVERDGRHLQASDLVGDVLRDEDEIVLNPDVQAGGPAPVEL